MKDTLREQIKACVSLATFKHNTALNDAGFQMDIDDMHRVIDGLFRSGDE